MGRANDRARAVSRNGIPASDGSARRRRQPRRGASRVRAMPNAPRGRARKLPLPGDRVDLPRAARSASSPGCAAAAAEPAIRDAAPLADLDRAPEPGFARRSARRKGVAVAAVVVAVTAAAVAGVLATRGGATHATAVAANAVGLIDTRSGRVSNQVPVGNGPTSVAVGEGSVWVTNALDGTVSRINPRTESESSASTSAAIRAGSRSAAGWSGSRTRCDGTVSRIDPQTNHERPDDSGRRRRRPPSFSARERSG